MVIVVFWIFCWFDFVQKGWSILGPKTVYKAYQNLSTWLYNKNDFIFFLIKFWFFLLYFCAKFGSKHCPKIDEKNAILGLQICSVIRVGL